MTEVMGIVNVTPDSFSDGGRYLDTVAAIEHGLRLVADGATILDVGGESTRPGATRVREDIERDRVLPVIAGLAAQGITVSVDTMRSGTATAALAAGATIVNDVSGGLADPAMAEVVADHDCRWILMHWRGHSDQMQQRARYGDVAGEVASELTDRVSAAVAAGVSRDRLAIDPGLGFAKTAEHNWELIARLDELGKLGIPIVLGASRKAFLGALLAAPDGTPRPAAGRDAASAALALFAARAGAWAVRVHDVRSTVDVLAVEKAVGRYWPANFSRSGGPDEIRTSDPSAGQTPAPDVISLTGLRAYGYHGVLEFERVDGQEFVVDARLELDTRPAAASDDLADTVSYADVAERLVAVITGEPVALLEKLVQLLADECLVDPRVLAAEVTVHKPGAPLPQEFSDVTVTVRRERAGGAT